MPRPLLYHVQGSPPSRAVMMLANIIGVELDYKELDFLNFEHKSKDFMKINPMGTVPTLRDGDFVISESHTIMKYLLTKYGGEKGEILYPSDIQTRALIDQCVFFETGVYFVRLKVVVLPTIFQGLQGITPKHIADIEEAYGVVEAYLGDKPYLVGDHLTLADLSLGATTTAMETLHKVDPKKFPRVADWVARLQKESFFKNINSKGVAALSQLVQIYWEKNKKNKV
ncbi:glutathione S-transferase 1 [Aphomia sociella]